MLCKDPTYFALEESMLLEYHRDCQVLLTILRFMRRQERRLSSSTTSLSRMPVVGVWPSKLTSHSPTIGVGPSLQAGFRLKWTQRPFPLRLWLFRNKFPQTSSTFSSRRPFSRQSRTSPTLKSQSLSRLMPHPSVFQTPPLRKFNLRFFTLSIKKHLCPSEKGRSTQQSLQLRFLILSFSS